MRRAPLLQLHAENHGAMRVLAAKCDLKAVEALAELLTIEGFTLPRHGKSDSDQLRVRNPERQHCPAHPPPCRRGEAGYLVALDLFCAACAASATTEGRGYGTSERIDYHPPALTIGIELCYTLHCRLPQLYLLVGHASEVSQPAGAVFSTVYPSALPVLFQRPIIL